MFLGSMLSIFSIRGFWGSCSAAGWQIKVQQVPRQTLQRQVLGITWEAVSAFRL